MTTKTELQQQIDELRARIEALPDDPPKPWEPRGGEWYLNNINQVYEGPSIDNTRLAGREFATERDAEAGARRATARDRYDAWVRENAEPGSYVVLLDATGNPVMAGPTLYLAPGELPMDLASAKRLCKLIESGEVVLCKS